MQDDDLRALGVTTVRKDGDNMVVHFENDRAARRVRFLLICAGFNPRELGLDLNGAALKGSSAKELLSKQSSAPLIIIADRGEEFDRILPQAARVYNKMRSYCSSNGIPDFRFSISYRGMSTSGIGLAIGIDGIYQDGVRLLEQGIADQGMFTNLVMSDKKSIIDLHGIVGSNQLDSLERFLNAPFRHVNGEDDNLGHCR